MDFKNFSLNFFSINKKYRFFLVNFFFLKPASYYLFIILEITLDKCLIVCCKKRRRKHVFSDVYLISVLVFSSHKKLILFSEFKWL